MYLQGSQDSHQLDLDAESKYNLSSLFLMKNAAKSIFEEISQQFSPENGSIFLLAGPGNNGNDTIITAKYLTENGYNVVLFLYPELANPGKFASLRDDLSFPTYPLDSVTGFEKVFNQHHPCLIVDGLFGVGLSRPIPDFLGSLFQTIHSMNPRPYILAVDIPSGISSDTGQILGKSLHANVTITFDSLKNGHLLYPGKEYSGCVKVTKIGFPESLLCEHSKGFAFLNDQDFYQNCFQHMPKRFPESYKGSYGKAGIWGGSKNYPGALAISTESCLRIGTGLVYGFFPEAHHAYINPLLPSEVIRMPFAAEVLYTSSHIFSQIIKLQALGFGPGLGRDTDYTGILKFLLQNTSVPMIVDADGLFFVKSLLPFHQGRRMTLTPHLGEMSYLTELPIHAIQSNLVEITREYANKWNATLVLKSSSTVIASPEGQYYIHSFSQSSLAKGGSGDLLTGLICGLQAQKTKPFWSAVLGVYLHGLIAKKASIEKSSWAVLPSDMINQIGKVLLNWERN